MFPFVRKDSTSKSDKRKSKEKPSTESQEDLSTLSQADLNAFFNMVDPSFKEEVVEPPKQETRKRFFSFKKS